jgi:DNA polymerase V
MLVLQQPKRKQGSNCKTMLLFASNSPHDERPVSYKAIVHFPCPTNCTVTLTKGMSDAAFRLFRENVRYYLIGVGLIDLLSGQLNQFDLFNQPTSNPALMNTLDMINHRYGNDTVFLAAQGIEHKWAMRRDLLTSQYTTKWRCVPQIKC